MTIQQTYNVLALTKGRERYVFIYENNPASVNLLLQRLGHMAADVELSLSWYDCAQLSQRLQKLAK